MGGVVRFIPNAPDLNEFEGNAFGGWSATQDGSDSYYGYGALNLPLVRDKLALRVAGGYEELGGFGDTGSVGFPATGEDQDGGTITSLRSSLEYAATDRLSIDVLFQMSESDFGASQSFNPFDRTRLISGPDDNSDSRYRMLAGTVNYDFGFAQLDECHDIHRPGRRHRFQCLFCRVGRFERSDWSPSDPISATKRVWRLQTKAR